MNKQLYFFTSVIATLLVVSTLSSVSAFSWPWDKPQLGPNSDAPACTNDIRPTNVYACKSVQAPRGVFQNLQVSVIDSDEIQLRASALDNRSSVIKPVTGNGLYVASYNGLFKLSGDITLEGSQTTNGVDNVEIKEYQGHLLITPSGSSQSSGTVKIYGDLAVGNGVHFNALAGPSNDNRSAYACLDRYGNLYRSDSPCR